MTNQEACGKLNSAIRKAQDSHVSPNELVSLQLAGDTLMDYVYVLALFLLTNITCTSELRHRGCDYPVLQFGIFCIEEITTS